MRKSLKVIIGLICFLGLSTSVFAASYSNSITANASNTTYEYVNGLPLYYNTASSYSLYVLNTGTYFGERTTLVDPIEANPGFAYIVNNSKVTSSSYKNYYIAQAAILWYQDYLNGNDANISSSLKNTISSNTGDTVSYYINKLVNNAKTYSTNGSRVKFLDTNITFTKNGNYYYSNVIDVETNNLNSTPTVRVYNAPSSTSIINNSIAKNGTGSFQIRIPVSSLNNIEEKDFEVYITGSGYDYTVYKYSNYGANESIYGRIYTTSSTDSEASMPVSIQGTGNTNVRISIFDSNNNYISGLRYNIYSGDCSNSTCYSDDLVHTFTTTSSYTSLSNILSSGTYTLVNNSNYNSYNLPYKKPIYINNDSSIQQITVNSDNYNNNYNNNNNNNNNYNNNNNNNNYNNNNYTNNNSGVVTREVNIFSNIRDNNDTIKIYSNSGVLIDLFKGNRNSFNIYLTEGTYYIDDTENRVPRLYFQITEIGSLLVKYDNDYSAANYITLDADNYDDSIIYDNNDNKVYYDEENNTYHIDGLEDLSIEIENTATADARVEWLSNVVDCPITSLSSTIKYITGAIILSIGGYLVIRNVKKSKNSI